MSDFQTLESLARQICDSRNGVGHYDKAGTHKRHWRAKAAQMMALAEAMPPYKTLARAIGWPA